MGEGLGNMAKNREMIRSYIPHVITLLNLWLGCGAVLSFFFDQNQLGIFLVLGAAIADFLDGAAARLLGVVSPLGKQLDSLADVISFGFVPGVIFYRLLSDTSTLDWKAMPAFMLTAFAAFRLATFNIDDRQSSSFIGLPTPACTLFVIGYVIWIDKNAFGLAAFLQGQIFIYVLIGILSWLMVSGISMFSLKFKDLGWGGNEIKYIFAAAIIAGLLIMQDLAIAPLVLSYVVLSIILNGFNTKYTS